MCDQADGAELLAIARTTFLNELLPMLPADLRYTALMVANVMQVAARELRSSDPVRNRELGVLEDLFGADAVPLDGEESGQMLKRLDRRLATEIRNGSWGRAQDDALRSVLLRRVHARLALSNPRYLQSWEDDDAIQST